MTQKDSSASIVERFLKILIIFETTETLIQENVLMFANIVEKPLQVKETSMLTRGKLIRESQEITAIENQWSNQRFR